ncbi:uncharacterized protein JCM6883_000416 [Sporobolomyces salmoneus]|uniref:uncharacterized protein n=1 Tax=Sporobolomyces salmoneus TaxID=183962 RepID=UPI0031769591
MASVLSPPLVPTPPSKPRPRSKTLSAGSVLPQSSSASLSRSSYQQPVGTGSIRRQMEQKSGQSRSRSQGDVASTGDSRGEIGKGKRRAVFCDVVLDEIDLEPSGECVYPPVAGSFVNSLGCTIRLPDSESTDEPQIRPMTPGKPPRVDLDRVRQNLHELWVTEESYLRKIKSLLRDYAAPLRSFSRKRETAIIPQFEASHLFINIEQLVPIAEAFERDLRSIDEEMRRDRTRLPTGFGETILSHVETMEPFKKWLANVGSSEAIRRDLEQRNSSFREFIERTQVHSRETAQTTGGFKEFLAEPFQRISRYRLMLDPIMHHIPQDSDDLEPLQVATGILTDICSMKVDDETRRAAIFWSLKETIDGFPDTMMAYDRQFIDCIDVDEIIEIADSRPTVLRCTLFLFSDTILIAKRPSGDRSGKMHAGLDDIDKLLDLFQTSHLSSSQANLLGSPKKLRRGVLGFRGLVDISTIAAVDLGPSDFGLVFDHPPTDQSERWCDRPARRYTVANTVQSDVKRAEKEVWLNRFGETVLHAKLRMGAKLAKKSKRIWEDGGASDSTEVYWSIWDRKTWESLKGSQKGKLALHLDEIGNSTVIDRNGNGRPQTIAHAVFLRDGGCRFEVFSNDSSADSAEVIKIDRIAPAVAAVGVSFGLYAFPSLRPQPASAVRSRSRPRSGLLGAALDVFGGGGALRRGNSITSRGSSIATTSIMTPNLSGSFSPRTNSPFVSLSPRPASTPAVLPEPTKRPISKKSAPDLYRRASHTSEEARESSMMENSEDVSDEAIETIDRSTRNTRSLSLPPPPHARLGSPTPSPERDTTPRAQSPLAQNVETSFNADTSVDLDSTMDASFEPDWPRLQEIEAPVTSPMAYRPPALGSTRRRMIGPREMRSASSLLGGGKGATQITESPHALPFAGPASPSPQRRSFTAHPAMPSTNDELSTALDSPPVNPVLEESPSLSSSINSKRSRPLVEASPRPTPRKKVAALDEATTGPRGPSALSQPLFPANRIPSASKEKRIPSGSHSKMRTRRITSNSSTIRGPPTPPKKESIPDVFSDPAEELPLAEDPTPGPDVHMVEDETTPFGRLRTHINDLRVKLAREAANKENTRVASPSSLSRSPHTRNVFAKSIVGELASPGPFADTRHKSHSVDVQVLSKWIRQLDDFVNTCESTISPPISPIEGTGDGPSAIEVEMLEQERDLLAAELSALKDEVATLVEQDASLRAALEAKESENLKLLHIYNDMAQEADTLLTEFNEALESVTLAAQAEPSATGEYVDLTNDLQTAVQKRFAVEHEFRDYKRKVQHELEEKARLERILRENGIAF